MDDELRAVLTKLMAGPERRTHGQERLTQGQERLTRELTELRTTVMSRFERVEDKLTSLSEDVSVNMMAVINQNTIRAAERENVDQLLKLMLAMQQQMLRLRTDVDELKKAS